MAKQQQKHPGKGWYTKQQMAELLNVTEQHFDRSLRQYAPADGQKTISDYKIDGQQLFYPNANDAGA